MSATVSTTTTRRTNKSTCRKCNRTVIVLEIQGRKVETDPELINVVPLDGDPAFVMARRAHADLCERYQLDNQKQRLTEEKKRYLADQKRKAAKFNGKRASSQP